ncbi:MAG: hypothetical protein CVU50_04120 [Candidatus Cloacimonetes bacterium HGW-Cloacimonetes-3]|nr:MAG: hypothetical protein CVU50_04120 [Candidatus Cloacimonetes bacterium HGW-Cloacimonetes-3]
MKGSFLTIVLLGLAITLCANVSYNYSLNTPKLEVQGNYTGVSLDNSNSWGEPGSPNLPWVGVKLLLPAGYEAQSIVVKRSNPQTYTLKAPIAPIQQQYPFSHPVREAANEPNPFIYNSISAYPTKLDNGLNTYFLSGNPIAFSAVSPFEYFPKTNKLVFYRNITVEISNSPGERALEAMSLLKQDAFTASRLRNSVDNPENIAATTNRLVGYDYLMVIDQAKYQNWVPLKSLYESRGLNVLVKSISEIIASSPGADTQEKLRNYIISIFATNPLRYVLLAGDTNIIPHRGFYVNMGPDGYTDDDIPADMYYSCLDGNWNTDGDNNWGEGNEADLAPELAIGRFCYNSDTEIANFLNKVMSYTLAPVESEIKTAFFAGEWLWDGPTWAGDYMDEMIGGSSAHGYTTVGVPSSWSINTLYDRTYGAADSWGASQIRPILSQGANFVNHLGHSNTTYNMRLSNNQVTATNITNNGSTHNYSIYFTQGCYAGAFDNRDTEPGNYTSDCITEKFTSIATAAVGMIAHSRYGWGEQGSTDGASQYIHRQYTDAIFGENIHELGYTLVDSKIDNIPYISGTAVMYWVTYETNLLGDPAMMLWTDIPQVVTANIPTEWMMGMNNYQISTNAPFGEFFIKNGTNTMYHTYANANGMISVNLFSSLTPGNYQVFINAPNFYAYETSFLVTASQMPYIVCNGYQFNDSDGLHHTGELLTASLYAKNVGLISLDTPATISLSSPSPNIQVLGSPVSLGAIAPGDSLALQGAFQFRIIGNFADGVRAKLVFTANYASHTTASEVYLPLNAPNLLIDSYQIINSSQIVMPGHNPSINISMVNSGSGNAETPMLILFSDSPYASFSDTELFFAPIMHNSTQLIENAFTININPQAPIDADITITYILTAENGSNTEGSFLIHLGAINFGFEPDFQGWQSISLDTGFTNQWHRSSTRNNTLNGTYSMKFGSAGTGQYSGNAYGALESPVMNVNPGCQLKFYHWMQAENHETQNTYAWDGGFVQMRLNDGNWQQINPVDGYPYRVYNNPVSPLAAETLVYSGSINWTEETFELGSVSGLAQFRWVFGSDGYSGGEGWYIDDVRIVGNSSAGDDPVVAINKLQLFENYPNPFNPSTNLRFSLPASTDVRLEIFNIKGQLVRTLLDTNLKPGSHNITWDGTDATNRTVASGVYYYRLSTPIGNQSKKMLLMK